MPASYRRLDRHRCRRSGSRGAFWGQLLCVLALVIAHRRGVDAWDQQPDGYEVIDGPDPQEDVDAWLGRWQAWREMELRTVRYDPNGVCTIYNHPASQWTQRSLLQGFAMLHDRDLFDRAKNVATPDKYLDKLTRRMGAIDSVLLWPAYPTIGLDARNQFDYLRTAFPTGLDGLRELVEVFHRRGVRVVLPYNPWDTATRDEPGQEDRPRMYVADIATLSALLPAVGADGFNGDTMYGVPRAFYNCTNPLVAVPEGGVPSAYLAHNPMSWGYFFGYAHFPPVARAKFLESRHIVQICARWSLDRLSELHVAFFNGVGYVVWENVWGIWNAMTAREDEATRRVFHALRYFATFLTAPDWRPYAFRDAQDQVYGTTFPHPQTPGIALLNLINVANQPRKVSIPLRSTLGKTTTLPPNATLYEVFRGQPLRVNGDSVVVDLPPRGFAAVLVTPGGELPTAAGLADFDKYMEERRAMTAVPLEQFSTARPLLQQTMARSVVPEAKPAQSSTSMVQVTGTRQWWFNVSGVQIEPVASWTPTWPEFGTGVQFPWEQRPWNNHSTELEVRDFSIDQFPVTNADFHAFLQRSDYEPSAYERFLEHWENRQDPKSGKWRPVRDWTVPKDHEQRPVVFVSVEDARAYASYYGKRLPHDWEWQYVASNGPRYDTYPWGTDELDLTLLHAVSREKNPPFPDPVGSHTGSKSVVGGVEDLVGYIWQMTDSFCDEHTCGLLLRGGSFYRPQASTLADPNWYFPQAYKANQHNRLLMLSQGHDRSPFVGFRCVQSDSPMFIAS